MTSMVSRPTAATSKRVINYFENKLELETDCWDVHHTISNNRQDYLLLDVRNEQSFKAGHIPTAHNLPHWEINESTLSPFSNTALFVVYCAGPHCNGADKAAIKLAKLNRPVKKMIGGMTGWLDEGFTLKK